MNKDPCQYGGIREMAGPATHRIAFSLMSKGKDAALLDMPCGAGAMTQRLVDAGFHSVTSADINPDEVRATGNKFVRVDLRGQTPFSDGQFEGVFCIECIEHLENPFHLMRELARILAPGGELIVTTPNVLSTSARSKFMTGGFFAHFDDLAARWNVNVALGGQAHIVPVPLHWLLYMAGLAGLELVHLGANVYGRRPRLNDRLIAAIVRRRSKRFYEPALFRLLTSDVALYGDILICKFVKRLQADS